VLCLPLIVRHALAFLEVPSGAKGPFPRARHHHGAVGFRVREQLGEDVQEIEAHLGVHCIREGWTVQRDLQDPLAGPLQRYGVVLVAHESSFSNGRSAWMRWWRSPGAGARQS